MSDIMIQAEDIGKKYMISHQFHGNYTALRDVIAEKAKIFAQRIITPFSSWKTTSSLEEFWALKNISFDIKKGDCVGIIGHNGAGKSTLLKILSRITEPSTGRVRINGKVASLLEVGTGFHPELTGRENIFLNGAILGMPKVEIKKKFDEIVAFAEVSKFLDTPVKRYSSGMYLRLAFAVAAHLEPEILLIDEVLSVGDLAFQKKCLGKMEEVASEGRTVLFVSHNLQIVNQLCPQSILLENGSLIANDQTNIILNLYSEKITPSEGAKDLSNSNHRSPDSLEKSLLKWFHIEIINSKKEVTSELKFGEPFEIILQGVALQKCRDLRVAFGIINRLSGVVFNSHQIFNGLKNSLPKGPFIFSIKINPNILAPGSYSINLGAVGYRIIDRLTNCIEFKVQEIGISPHKVWNPSYKRGVVDLPWCKWRIIKS